MKKTTFLLSFMLIAFTSCSTDGEVGPRGPQGPEGEPGINILGQTFGDLDVRDFTYDDEFNLYYNLVEIPGDVEVLESDAILVYRFEVIDNIDTWSLIPHSIFLADGGIIQYSFNHTPVDVELLITGNFDLSTLDDFYTQTQYFKFVVVPSDFVSQTGVDVANYDAVMSVLQE